jgi:hypothetical protein
MLRNGYYNCTPDDSKQEGRNEVQYKYSAFNVGACRANIMNKQPKKSMKDIMEGDPNKKIMWNRDFCVAPDV